MTIYENGLRICLLYSWISFLIRRTILFQICFQYIYVYTLFNTFMYTLFSIHLCIHYFQYNYVYTIFNTFMYTLFSIQLFIHYFQYNYVYTIFNTIMYTLFPIQLCIHYFQYNYVYNIFNNYSRILCIFQGAVTIVARGWNRQYNPDAG